MLFLKNSLADYPSGSFCVHCSPGNSDAGTKAFKEEIMKKVTKPQTLYKSPFCRQYWRDAALELRDTRMLVIAAMMIALRVALKGLYIPIAPNLNINIAAPLINAAGAMIFGPVVAAVAACVSDTLGVILFPQGTYFFPYMFIEVAGSVLFAMFFYRAKVTATRVILARFSMDLFVNIILNSAVSFWYYSVIMGKSYAALVLPAVIKNLCMFPIEAFILALFMAIIIPITRHLKLTYDTSADKNSLKFSVRQVIMLIVLLAVGIGCVVGYLFYHYDRTSLSSKYTAEERYDKNTEMDEIIHAETDDWDDDVTVSVIESAYRKFGKGYITYNVALYTVDEDTLSENGQTLDDVRGLSKSPAAKNEALTRAATAEIRLDRKTGEILEFSITPES